MQGKAGAPLLSFFWDLASVEADKRVTAAVSLISVLQQAQSEAATAGVACTDLAYAIRRLVRGLASPRDGARQGFGAALVELLVTFPKEVALESVLTLMEESMQLQGSMKGPEERDMLFGRVFTCAAVIRSARLATLATKPRAALVERLVKELLFCLGKKTFLQAPTLTLSRTRTKKTLTLTLTLALTLTLTLTLAQELGTVILCELLRQLPAAELQATAGLEPEP